MARRRSPGSCTVHFLVRHASFINFLFFTYLAFFHGCLLLVFILGKVGTVVDSSLLRGRKLAARLVGWLVGWLASVRYEGFLLKA